MLQANKQRPKGLGRGLDVLLGTEPPQAPDSELRQLALHKLQPGRYQPRTRMDEQALQELAESILAHGIMQPIVVRPAPGAANEDARGRYEIIAGERRYRAARLAGLETVPVIVKEVADDQALSLALIENIQRQELNPVEEALAYQKLIQDYGLTQDELARQVSKDRSSIANHLRLLKLPTEVQQMLEDGRLSMGHARALLAIEHEDRLMNLAREVIANQMSVRETEKLVKQAASGDKSNPSSGEKDPVLRPQDANLRAAELKLKRHLGAQVRIHLTSGDSGRVEIGFSSMGELDRIYSLIVRRTET